MRRKSGLVLILTPSFPSYSTSELRKMAYNLLTYRHYMPSPNTPSQEFFYLYSLFQQDAQKDNLDPFPIKRVILVKPKK